MWIKSSLLWMLSCFILDVPQGGGEVIPALQMRGLKDWGSGSWGTPSRSHSACGPCYAVLPPSARPSRSLVLQEAVLAGPGDLQWMFEGHPRELRSHRLYRPCIRWWPHGPGLSWALQEEGAVCTAAPRCPPPARASHQPSPQGGGEVPGWPFKNHQRSLKEGVPSTFPPEDSYLEGQEWSAKSACLASTQLLGRATLHSWVPEGTCSIRDSAAS